MIGAEGSAHGGDSDSTAAVVPDKRHNFLAQIGVEDGLHVATMKRMRAFVVKAEAVDRVNAVKLDFAAVDEVGEGADHALAFEFEFVAGTGRKAENGRAPVAVDHDAKLESEPVGIPAMIFTFHDCTYVAFMFAGTQSMPAAQWEQTELRGREPAAPMYTAIIVDRAQEHSSYGQPIFHEPPESRTNPFHPKRISKYGGAADRDRESTLHQVADIPQRVLISEKI
jgi:hypothetical protein